MDNIRRSVFGYNKKDVHNLLFEIDTVIDTQRKDIDYLRTQNESLTNELNKKSLTSTERHNLSGKLENGKQNGQNVNRATKIEQDHLNNQKEM